MIMHQFSPRWKEVRLQVPHEFKPHLHVAPNSRGHRLDPTTKTLGHLRNQQTLHARVSV